MNFSRQLAAFLRAGIPILDALDTLDRRRRATRSSKDVLVDITDALRSGDDLVERDGRARRDVPQLLHRHPAFGRAHRKPRLRPRPARELHRARSRGQAGGEVGAHLPGGHHGDGGRSRCSCSWPTCSRSSRPSSKTSTPSSRFATRMLLSTSRLHREHVGVPRPRRAWSSPSCSSCTSAAHRDGCARDRDAAAPARDRRRSCATRSSNGSAASSARCCAPACRFPTRCGRRRKPRTIRVYQRALDAGARREVLRGAGLSRPISDDRSVPRRRGADAPGGRGVGHARPTARARGRLLRGRARLTGSSASPPCSSPPSSSSWASSSASSRSRSCPPCTASSTR